MLHGVVDGGNHLASGDPCARWPCLFDKKGIKMNLISNIQVNVRLEHRNNQVSMSTQSKDMGT